MVKKLLAATLAASALLAQPAYAQPPWATPRQAVTIPAQRDVVYGNNDAARYTFVQSWGDCEEVAVDFVFGAVKGHRMHEKTVVNAALRLGVMKDLWSGSDWDGPRGIVALLGHFGLRARIGARDIGQVEADLRLGDHVIAFVNADTLWRAAFTNIPTHDYATADHSVVIDSIDATKGTATISDPGSGETVSVSLKVLRAAMGPSGDQVAVVTTRR